MTQHCNHHSAVELLQWSQLHQVTRKKRKMIVKPMSYICKQAHGCRVGLHFSNPSCALRCSPLTACTHLNTHLGWRALPWSEWWLHQQGWWIHHGSLHHAEGFTLKESLQCPTDSITHNVVISDAVITVVLWSLLRHTKHTGCPHSSSAPHVSTVLQPCLCGTQDWDLASNVCANSPNWVNVFSKVLLLQMHELPSPPHTPHASSLAPEPRAPSQPMF